MQTDDLVIRAQVQSGVWETIGAERGFGIVPENVSLTSNPWGNDTASFDLRRDPSMLWPDLAAFTPIECEIGGEIVWTGRLKQTPAREGDDPVINIQAEGWQYHLDDDAYAKSYVHSDVTAWRDVRTFPNTPLGAVAGFSSAWQVNNEGGIIQMGIPTNAQVPPYWAAVALDLGPFAYAKRIVITAKGGGRTNLALYLQSSNSLPSSGEVSQSRVALTMPTTDTIYSLTLASLSRYVGILLSNDSGGVMTGDDNSWVQIKSVQVFYDTAYESGNASILHASDVVKDADAQATTQLSSDTSQISTTSFAIPDFHFEDSPKTPREAWEAANALHNYVTQIDVDKRPVFKARPTAPVYEVGAWGGSVFEDSSMNSGQDVYNRVLVTGTGPDGTPIIVPRYSAQSVGNVRVRGQVSASWTSGGSTTPTDNFGSIVNPVLVGMPIVVVATISAVTGAAKTLTLTVGNTNVSFSGYNDYGTFSTQTINGTYTFLWIPTKTHTDSLEVRVDISNTSMSSGTVVVDVYRGNTVLDKRGFQRTKILPVNAALTTAVANQVGDTYLTAHQTQPLTGRLTLTPTGLRRVLSGENVHPAHLLRDTQQMIRLSNRINPDDGSVGRDGIISTVSYTHDSRESVVELDDSRSNFEALVQRFSVLSGGNAAG